MTPRKPTPSEIEASENVVSARPIQLNQNEWPQWQNALLAWSAAINAADYVLRLADRIRAERLALNPYFYESPAHGWTCFHCGETFHEQHAARDHFGAQPLAEAACRIKDGDEITLVQKYRQLEAQLAAIVENDTEQDRRMGEVQAQHARALRAHGDAEYARGLNDGITHADIIHAERAELEGKE